MSSFAEDDFLSDWRACAAERPPSIALVCADRQWTYSELDRDTDGLAMGLADYGLGPEQWVIAQLASPVDCVRLLLATLKVGAALFLAPSNWRLTTIEPAGVDPTERRFPIADAAAGSIHGQFALHVVDKTSAVAPRDVPTVGLSSLSRQPWSVFAWQSRFLTPRQVAYAFATSGSTGPPKLAMSERGNLSTFCRAVRDWLGLRPMDRWLQLAALSFDVFLEETLPILSAGGTVVAAGSNLADIAWVQGALETYGITHVEMTTRYWYAYMAWLAATQREPPQSLKTVIVGGEWMDPAAYRAWQARDWPELVHVYGTTETAVTSCMFCGRLAEAATSVPVGQPLANSRVAIEKPADGDLQTIYLTGACVGRGYWHEPGLTAARFVPDPHGSPGSRRYDTGDLGQVSESNQLTLLGRSDDQIKLRGYRLRLSSVEMALRAVPGVDEAAAIVDSRRNSALVGVLVSDQLRGEADTLVELDERARQFIFERLPDWLPLWARPNNLYVVASLPRTVNGKLDRTALSDWLNHSGEPVAQVAPSAEIEHSEQIVLLCFRAALAKPDLTWDDDFFDAGGDSLSALALVTSLQAPCGPMLSAADLFDSPTPRQFAERWWPELSKHHHPPKNAG